MSKQADILEFEGAVKDYMRQVQDGEAITILKDGIPVATVQPLAAPASDPVPRPKDFRRAGKEKGNVKIYGDLKRPYIPLEDWNMLKD